VVSAGGKKKKRGKNLVHQGLALACYKTRPPTLKRDLLWKGRGGGGLGGGRTNMLGRRGYSGCEGREGGLAGQGEGQMRGWGLECWTNGMKGRNQKEL